MSESNINMLVNNINDGQLCVIPTDTLYGISCSALNPEAVEKIYELKIRERTKPFIILINTIDDLKKFEINITSEQNIFLQKHWPNKITVILECDNEKFSYLHRGQKSLAFRIPFNNWLQNLLKMTGPLVSTTVNIAGEPPIINIETAKKTFGEKISHYEDIGILESSPSTVIKLKADGTFEIVRQGAINL